jgi:hypothetical protein
MDERFGKRSNNGVGIVMAPRVRRGSYARSCSKVSLMERPDPDVLKPGNMKSALLTLPTQVLKLMCICSDI